MNRFLSAAACGLLLSAGCSPAAPAPGDTLLLTAPEHLWTTRADFNRAQSVLEMSSEETLALWADRSKGDGLHGGTNVQVIEVMPDVMRVRVTDDAAGDAVKSTFGTTLGKIGFIRANAQAAKVSR